MGWVHPNHAVEHRLAVFGKDTADQSQNTGSQANSWIRWIMDGVAMKSDEAEEGIIVLTKRGVKNGQSGRSIAHLPYDP